MHTVKLPDQWVIHTGKRPEPPHRGFIFSPERFEQIFRKI
jgi:hypothetical protein